jgi:hypothetical protein
MGTRIIRHSFLYLLTIYLLINRGRRRYLHRNVRHSFESAEVREYKLLTEAHA